MSVREAGVHIVMLENADKEQLFVQALNGSNVFYGGIDFHLEPTHVKAQLHRRTPSCRQKLSCLRLTNFCG
ncbi:hypothetical protein PHMEG_00014445 [Phytophthora megakarya]|uniref:Uncharacterized protein n=1 Tax=Phytophthora megakarya TaxID=4795 RepID=A0A225W3S4_9STRA|nr:hypothetical protein PHMEG_00014445 [Phytophthora megakarya]